MILIIIVAVAAIIVVVIIVVKKKPFVEKEKTAKTAPSKQVEMAASSEKHGDNELIAVDND